MLFLYPSERVRNPKGESEGGGRKVKVKESNCPSPVHIVCIEFISVTYSTDIGINNVFKCW